MKTVLFILLLSFNLWGQSFEEMILDRKTSEISSQQLFDYLIASSPIIIGECEISGVRKVPGGISFHLKKGFRSKRYTLPLSEEKSVRIEHSNRSTMLFYYPGYDGVYLQFDRDGKLEELQHSHKLSLLEKFLPFDSLKTNSCTVSSDAIDESNRQPSSETETPGATSEVERQSN